MQADEKTLNEHAAWLVPIDKNQRDACTLTQMCRDFTLNIRFILLRVA